ncbi:putative tartrate transporter [Peptococcaceae bacterium CEB3]|nr:putative tartrate transporter [Peptococcaceae bacterium CEB3]
MENVTNFRWRHIIPAAVVMYMMAFMDRTNISFAAPGMIKDFHITHATAGWVMGIFFIGYMIMQVPGGYLAQRWSAKKLITILMVIWSLFAIWSGLAQNVNQELWSRFFLGVTEGAIWPAVLVMIADWFPKGERASANAYWQICLPITGIITMPLSGWILAATSDWRVMLLIEAIPPLVWAVFWWLLVEDHPHQAKWLPAGEREYIETKLTEERKAFENQVKVNAFSMMYHPKVLLLTLAYFLTIMGTYGLSLWAPSIIKALGVGYLATGLLLVIPNAFSVWTMIYAARVSDRTGKRSAVVAIVLIIATIGYFLLGAVGTMLPWLAVLFMTIAQGGINARQGPLWAIPTDTLPQNTVGPAMAIIGAIGNLGGLAGPWMMGFVKTTTHSFMLGFYVLAGCLVASAILVMLVSDRKVRVSEGTNF